jgi:hypothetical protein
VLLDKGTDVNKAQAMLKSLVIERLKNLLILEAGEDDVVDVDRRVVLKLRDMIW